MFARFFAAIAKRKAHAARMLAYAECQQSLAAALEFTRSGLHGHAKVCLCEALGAANRGQLSAMRAQIMRALSYTRRLAA